MTKNELLDFLKQCLNAEEKAIPLYTQHLSNTLFLSGFKPEEQTKIKELLLLLHRESEFHARTYHQLIETVQGAEENVY